MVTCSYRNPGVIQNFFCCLSVSWINFEHSKKKVLSCDLKIVDFSISSCELICAMNVCKFKNNKPEKKKMGLNEIQTNDLYNTGPVLQCCRGHGQHCTIIAKA